MTDKPQSEQQVVRLTTDTYRHLEGQLPIPWADSKTTDVQAGFALGVQYVLKKLREGFVVP